MTHGGPRSLPKPDRPTRILAWAKTPTGFCIASPATLSYGDEQGWKHRRLARDRARRLEC